MEYENEMVIFWKDVKEKVQKYEDNIIITIPSQIKDNYIKEKPTTWNIGYIEVKEENLETMKKYKTNFCDLQILLHTGIRDGIYTPLPVYEKDYFSKCPHDIYLVIK